MKFVGKCFLVILGAVVCWGGNCVNLIKDHGCREYRDRLVRAQENLEGITMDDFYEEGGKFVNVRDSKYY